MRRNRAPRPPAIQVVRDAEAVFEEAIDGGALSADPAHPLHAGRYMYMFHDEDGTAWFKNRDTREYLAMRARKRAAEGTAKRAAGGAR